MRLPKRRRWAIFLAAFIALLGLTAGGAGWWYAMNLKPARPGNTALIRVEIPADASGDQIGALLEERGLIRSRYAFKLYLRLKGVGRGFRAGVYALKPGDAVPSIVAHLTEGRTDEFAVHFYPEGTLRGDDFRSVTSALKKAGYTPAQIEHALRAPYRSVLFNHRPAGADLEGYVYGETYFMAAGATAEEAIQRAIAQLETIVQEHQLEQKFRARGLTLHEGITLASIVQKESKGCGQAPTCDDQRRIAAVFYNRLKRDMPLGSDVTYHYAADKAGLPRDHRLDSPYNTRIHKGLPPGPIAAPGLSALRAVAEPAENDALYFLSGDDDVTYFARTNEEHEANIKAHCHQKCQLP